MSRKAGILLPIFSLPSEYGIGTLGRVAYRWVDFLNDAHQKLWQVLPVGPTSYGDSPYQSFSAFAGNPYFIDLELLCDQELLTKDECTEIQWEYTSGKIEYKILYDNRFALLRKAYQRYPMKQSLHEFIKENAWAHDYALFMAIKDSQKGKSWQEWPELLRNRNFEALAKADRDYHDDILFYVFLQKMFFEQWKNLKQYANAKDVQIVGDIPIYVALDSADVWAHQEYFNLDTDGHPTEVAGCPPDAFAATGQLWGNPTYRWNILANQGYSWWLERLSMSFELFDYVRIDHFRGFESYSAIPAKDKTAENGCWRQGPGKDFINAIKDRFGDPHIIAEDLGFLTKEVKDLLQMSGFPGMKVLQFAFDTRESNNYLPYTYVKNCVVYTGTHDNDTLHGWTLSAAPEDVRYAKEYIDYKDEQTIKIWTQSGGYSWYTPGGWEFLEDTEITTYPSDAETVAYIKSIIDSGIPPLCHCPGGRGHWMVAYDYTSGSTFEDILIVDPADGNQKTLAAGMRLSCDGTAQGITRIRKASSAH